MILIFDDVLTPSYSDAIHVEAHQQRYYYSNTTSVPSFAIGQVYDCGQLECPLYNDNTKEMTPNLFYQIKPLLLTAQDLLKDRVKFTSINRCKINILWQKESFPENHHNYIHHDTDEGGCLSLLYYVNDSDGDTFIFNEKIKNGVIPSVLTLNKRITPKKNRLVVFDSSRYHASSNPRFSRERIVINTVMRGEFNELLF